MCHSICPFIQNFQGVGTLHEKTIEPLQTLGSAICDKLFFSITQNWPPLSIYAKDNFATLQLLRISVIIKDFSYKNNKLGSLFIALYAANIAGPLDISINISLI